MQYNEENTRPCAGTLFAKEGKDKGPIVPTLFSKEGAARRRRVFLPTSKLCDLLCLHAETIIVNEFEKGSTLL